MSEKRLKSFTIYDAKVIFKNFSGEGSQYNRAGDRNFGVLLDDQLAEELAADGWNVKRLNPREDDPEQYRQPWLPVKVKFGLYPPIVMLINSMGKKSLTEDTIGQLDGTIFQTCDLTIRPYQYPAFGGRPDGVAAYLKAIYVTKVEDDLELKYAELRDLDEN